MEKSAIADTCVTRTPSGINIAAGSAVVTAVATVAAAMSRDVPDRLAVMATAVAGYATVITDTRASVAVAAVAYLLFNGFLVNRHGELTWDGITSIWHFAVFFFAIGLGPVRRRILFTRLRAALAAELDEPVNTPTSKR